MMDERLHITLDILRHLRNKSKKLRIDERYRSGGMFSGRAQSKLKGQGYNFDELRPFRFGDNPRDIDWKASSRSGKQIVKVFTQETDKPTVILCNQNEGMLFGSKVYTKSVVAAHLAALLGFHFLEQGERVGGIVVDKHGHQVVPPKRGVKPFTRYLDVIVKSNQALLEVNKSTAIEKADANLRFKQRVSDATRLLSSNGTLVVISDLESIDLAMLDTLKLITHKHNVLFFLVYDPLEVDYSQATDLAISDGITQVSLSTSKKAMESFRKENEAKIEQIQKLLSGSGLSFAMLDTIDEPYKQLSKLITGKA